VVIGDAGEAGTNLPGRFIDFNAPEFLYAPFPQLLFPVVADGMLGFIL
jgi:hypothetical protein